MDGWRDPLQALQLIGAARERAHQATFDALAVTYTSRAPTATNAAATNA